MANSTHWSIISKKNIKNDKEVARVIGEVAYGYNLNTEGFEEYNKIFNIVMEVLGDIGDGADEILYGNTIFSSLESNGYIVESEEGVPHILATGENGFIILQVKYSSGIQYGFYELWKYLEKIQTSVGFFVYISKRGLMLNMMVKEDDEWFCFNGKTLHKMNLKGLEGCLRI